MKAKMNYKSESKKVVNPGENREVARCYRCGTERFSIYHHCVECWGCGNFWTFNTNEQKNIIHLINGR